VIIRITNKNVNKYLSIKLKYVNINSIIKAIDLKGFYMYHDSNKSENDYHDAYEKSISKLEAYKKEEEREQIIKIIFSLFALLLLIVAGFYLYRYFYPISIIENSLLHHKTQIPTNKIASNLNIKERQLPINIQINKDLNNNI